jgi:hypothetical protein
MKRHPLLEAALVIGLTLAAAAPSGAQCVLDEDCPALQCNSVTCQAGTCTYAAANELALCDDGDKCTLGERCLLGTCTPPEDAGRDSDADGDCDADEVECGCDPNDGAELCPLPNRLVGRAGSGLGDVLMAWNTPTVTVVYVDTDPSCATTGACTEGRCTSGKIGDVCTTGADCDQPPETCRVIVNWADTADLTLLFARLRRDDVSGFTVKPGCSRKVDVTLPRRPAPLKLRAQGTVSGRLWRDRDFIRYR